MKDWETLADRLRRAGAAFVIEPYVRFKGEVGEQATHVLSRSRRQCARVQGIPRHRPALRKIIGGVNPASCFAGLIALPESDLSPKINALLGRFR
jgi:hypothetical protein